MPNENEPTMQEDIASLLGDTPAEPVADEPTADAPVADEPAVDEPAADDVVEPAVEFEMPTEIPDDPTALKALIVSMGAQMADLRKSLAQPVAPVVPAPTEPVVPAAPAVTDPAEVTKSLLTAINEGAPLLSQEEQDSVVDNPALINTAINRGLERFIGKFIESLPALTGQLVDQHTATRTVVDKFYADNKDLTDFKPYLKTVSQEILSKNPKLSVADMLLQTAAEARKRLKLPAPKVAGATPKPASTPVQRAAATKPAFVKQRQGAVAASVATRASAKPGSSEKEQISDMLK